MRRLLLVMLLLTVLLPGLALAQVGATPTPTPYATPTAIPVITTTLQLTNIVSDTRGLAAAQTAAWAPDADYSGVLMGLAAVVLGLWLIPFVRELSRRRAP